MKKLFVTLFFLMSASTTSAQLTGPRADRRDSVRTPVVLQVPSGQSLPPSMLLELRRSQGKRTLIYRDTVKASDIERAHLNDSVERQYIDSAFTLSDTAVSLSHKEWLDSQLVEIPELERFGSKVHFTYPTSVMVETDVQSVPFDTSLLGRMNPISRENLPFFDQSPMPLPLKPSSPFEGYVEAGAGNLYLPIAGAWISNTISPRSYLDAKATYLSRTSSAIKGVFQSLAGFHTQLGVDPAQELYESTNLSIALGYDSKMTGIRSQLDTALINRTQSLFKARLSLLGDATDKFHYDLQGADNEFKDLYSKGLSESQQDIDARLHYDPYISHFRFIAEAGYHVASLRLDTVGTGGAIGSSNPARTTYMKAFFGRRKGEAIEWYGGLAYLGGIDAKGVQHNMISPAARVRIPLNPRWELGGYYDPNVQLASMQSLAIDNPFYSPYAAAPYQLDSGIHRLDVRSAMFDKVRFGAFMNYALSPDDEIRTEVRFISRSGEPVFSEHTIDSATHVFSVDALDTRRLQVIFGSNFLLFTRDVLSSSITYSSATATAEDKSLAFEPSLNISVEYHFNSLSHWFQPIIEFRAVTRSDRTITLVNAEAHAEISPKIAIFVRAENLAGSASDFWTGYEETPRSIWATVRFAF